MCVGDSDSTSSGTGNPSGPSSSHGSSSIRFEKNSQIARPAASRGSATRTPKAIDLAAREQPEDDEQRMQPQCGAHHIRDDNVTFDLVDAQEQQGDPES